MDEQDGITTRNGARVEVHNDDIVGILSYNIFVGIAVATIFGSGFFFDLFWPLRKESTSVRIAWKLCSLLVSIMALADVLALTVSKTASFKKIVLIRHTGHRCNASFNHYRSISSNSKSSLPWERNADPHLQKERLLRCFSRFIVAGDDSFLRKYIYHVEVDST